MPVGSPSNSAIQSRVPSGAVSSIVLLPRIGGVIATSSTAKSDGGRINGAERDTPVLTNGASVDGGAVLAVVVATLRGTDASGTTAASSLASIDQTIAPTATTAHDPGHHLHDRPG